MRRSDQGTRLRRGCNPEVFHGSMDGMSASAARSTRFEGPACAPAQAPRHLNEVAAEATRMHELRLAELRSLVSDLEQELGPITDEERQAMRDEWTA